MTERHQEHHDFKKSLASTTSPKKRADLLNDYAWSLRYTDNRGAYIYAEEALVISREEYYRRGIAEALRTLGSAYLNLDNYTDSLQCANEARDLFEELGDLKGKADVLNTLGGVYNQMGDLDNRLQCNIQCLHLRQEIEDQVGEVGSFNNIGDTYMSMGDYHNALQYFEHCLTLDYMAESTRAVVVHNLGEVSYLQGKLDKALKYLDEAIVYGERTNFRSILCSSYNLKAQVLLDQELIQKAYTFLKKAEEVALKIEAKTDLYRIYKNYSKLYELEGNVKQAFGFFKKYHNLKEEVYSDEKLRKAKSMQFQYELKAIREDTEKERQKNQQLRRAYARIEQQNLEISQQHRNITDSIHYAQCIQEAILPSKRTLNGFAADSFVIYLPKAIVSGDFYWIKDLGDKVLFAAVDCTGHGVPGALLTTFAYDGLNRVVNEFGLTSPAAMLDKLNAVMVHEFVDAPGIFGKQEYSIRDGMDLALCCLNRETNEIEYAGANNSLLIISSETTLQEGPHLRMVQEGDHKLYEIKSDRQCIDFFSGLELPPFTNHKIQLSKGDNVYVFSDGYADQFGGLKGKKMLLKRFKSQLLSIVDKPMQTQKEELLKQFEDWKGEMQQVDDVCVIGVRV